MSTYLPSNALQTGGRFLLKMPNRTKINLNEMRHQHFKAPSAFYIMTTIYFPIKAYVCAIKAFDWKTNPIEQSY